MQTLHLEIGSRILEFQRVSLVFLESDIRDVFGRKNNKTLAQTLAGTKYRHLRQSMHEKYGECLNERLGEFLLRLKTTGDEVYRQFLNPYGDEAYCRFAMERHQNSKGLYSYVVGETICYIGRCRDSFGKRINHGYGRIAPKNCYLDGRSTNCRLNSLINAHKAQVGLYLCPLEDDPVIETCERSLIQELQPAWNIQLKA